MIEQVKSVLLLGLITTLATLGLQAQTDQEIYWLKVENGLVYINNAPGVFFSIEFPGDSLQNAGSRNTFVIEGAIYQIVCNPFDQSKYKIQSNSERAKELLKYYQDQEVEYLSEEIFEQDLKSEQEWFENSWGKRFNLWHFEVPEVSSDSIQAEIRMKWQLYLTFISNQHVVGINIPIESNEDINKKIAEVKRLAENIDIYGYKADAQALFTRLGIEADGSYMNYSDSLKGFEFSIPHWLNLIESDPKQFWMATFPDIDNIKNALILTWYEKGNYKSFKDFNRQSILDKKIGDSIGGNKLVLKKELETPENCNGICYKFEILQGRSLYHTQYLTFETSTHYLQLMFSSTAKTYEVNMPKLAEFLSGFHLLN